MILNTVDYCIIGVIAFSLVISVIRGFVREALSLTAWILAFWVGFTFFANISDLLKPYINNPTIRMASAFFGLFLVTLICGSIISYLISQAIKKTGLTGTDRSLGLAFGAGRGVLIVAVLILLINLTSITQQAYWKGSTLIPYFSPITVWLKGFLPKEMQKIPELKE